MKILVLMPNDERQVYNCVGLFKAFDKKMAKKIFLMPLFEDYLVKNGLAANWTEAVGDTIVVAEKMCAAKDMIIFGNVHTSVKFDAIFNFQDAEESLPYKDIFLDKIIDLAAHEWNEPVLTKFFVDNGFYAATSSILALHNYKATADFLTAYLQTDPKLDEIAARYKIDMNRIKRILKNEKVGKAN